MKLDYLKKAPFRLDASALAWVGQTFAGLSPKAKLGQLVVPLCIDLSRDNLDRFIGLGVGGMLRVPSLPLARLRADASYLQRRSAVPLLMCADLEYAEMSAVGGAGGTAFPNQMTVAATNDAQYAEKMARVAAREGRAAGFNWSFTPVVDLDRNTLNPVVNTRSFGGDTERVSRFARAYVAALQAEGIAACAKHWPGDGLDDRNQHYVTSVNHYDLPTWEKTFGQIYGAMVRQGVLSIMSGHIALPAFPGAGLTPGSISRRLNRDLLRGRLKFNGLIISDASIMAGLTSHGSRNDLVPQLIENGCDMVLFPDDVELDFDYLARAVTDGRLTSKRVDEAVLRTLALKAALGLHRRSAKLAALPRARQKEHHRWARECAERAVTLVKDDQRLLPLSPARHRRVLLIQPASRRYIRGPLPELQIHRLLTAAGFLVERYSLDTAVHRDHYDVIIYAVAEEGAPLKTALHLRWAKLHGDWTRAMERHWHEVPTVFISMGTPWHLREVPTCPTYINAYSPVPVMQEAVVKALLGEIKFRGVSPVDLKPLLDEMKT